MAANLCATCMSIDVRQPYWGPEHVKSGHARATRVFYAHASTLHNLLTSAIDKDCLLCCIILDVIRKHYVLISNKKNVLDDWDYVDDLDDFDHDDSDADSSSQDEVGFRSPIDSFETAHHNLSDLEAPILLEFVFRDARRDELGSRSTDIAIHWTQAGGLARTSTTTSALSFVSGLPDELNRLCSNRNVHLDTGTDGEYSRDMARIWMKHCDEQHQLCRERRAQRKIALPTRVIAVGGHSVHPHLVETHGDSADYTCLSHCWGKSQPYKTELASLQSRKVCLKMEEMPKTFQDAVVITRNLGIQYLWIDSLCIIQNSADDWARESARMGSIYRDAALTIFAEWADSDAGGCFIARPVIGRTSSLCRTPMFDDLLSLYSDKHIGGSQTFVQEKLHHAGSHSLPERHSIFESIKNLEQKSDRPLSTRGWVLQESVLSFRSLTYDQNEVRWSCPTMKACECMPEGHHRKSWSDLDKGDAAIVDKRDLSNAWASIVHNFSLRDLTFGKDKLPALSGIAAEMSSYRPGVKYLAGVWADDLRRSLAWFVPPRSPTAPYREIKRTQGCCAPSWSWANVDGEVRMHHEHGSADASKETDPAWMVERTRRTQSLLCEIIQCETRPISNLNIFGDCSGTLILRGRLGRATCCPPITNGTSVDRIPITAIWPGKEIGWFDPDISVTPATNVPSDIYCMPLYLSSGDLWVIALTPVSTSTPSPSNRHSSTQGQFYHRIGIVRAKYVFAHEIQAEPIKHFSSTAEHNNAILTWLEKCPVETITVI